MLWVVATPIGNLGDFSPRAKEVLAQADVILAEDTRQAGLLFQRAGLKGGRFMSLFDHNEEQRLPAVLSILKQGQKIALISNAGTPILSDPGYLLVKTCRNAGYPVRAVPGPCAPIAALMVCGLPAQPCTFLGFLPRKAGDVKKALIPFKDIQTTLIFFERKSRLWKSLKLAYEILGRRQACLARELTKEHEETLSFDLGDWQSLPSLFRGEFTVVLGPAEKSRSESRQMVIDFLLQEIGKNLEPNTIMRKAKKRFPGWSRKDIYRIFLDLQSGHDQEDSHET